MSVLEILGSLSSQSSGQLTKCKKYPSATPTISETLKQHLCIVWTTFEQHSNSIKATFDYQADSKDSGGSKDSRDSKDPGDSGDSEDSGDS